MFNLDMSPCPYIIAHMDMAMAPCLHIITHMDMDMPLCLHMITHMDLHMVSIFAYYHSHGSGYGPYPHS